MHDVMVLLHVTIHPRLLLPATVHSGTAIYMRYTIQLQILHTSFREFWSTALPQPGP